MDLAYLLRVLLKRKWIILLATILASIAAVGFTFLKKRLYSSSAQYSTGFSADKVRLVDGSVDVYETDTKFNNVIETFKSPRVIGMLSYRLLLHDLNNPDKAYKTLSNTEKNSKEYRAVDIHKAKEILAEKINDNVLISSRDPEEKKLIELLKLYGYDYFTILKFLSINRISRTDYIDVVFQSENADMSAFVVNTLGVEYLRFYESLSEERSRKSFDTIGSLVQQKKSYVDSLYREYEREQQRRGTLNPQELSTNALETIKEFNSKLASSREEYNKYKNALDAYQSQLNAVQSTGGGTSNNAEIIRLRERRDQLVSQNLARGGNDQTLLNQIENLNLEIGKKSANTGSGAKKRERLEELNDKVAEAKASLRAANENIEYYTEQIRKLQPLTNIAPGSNVKIEQLKSLLDIETKQYGNVVDKYNQAQSLLKDNPNSNFKQTLIGQPAVEPESAHRLLTGALAGATVFFLMVLLFVFTEIFDNTIKTPSQFSRILPLKLLSTVNNVDVKKQTIADIILTEYDETNKVTAAGTFKESMRKLRYQVEQSDKRVLLFTSMQQGEGKSLIIEGLARSMQLCKHRILIIDANFSNNTLTRHFQAKPLLEVADKMMGNDFNIQAAQRFITKTDTRGIDIIGCRGGNYTPSEVLSGNNILANLSIFSGEYDYIFIEGAALNNHADSKELVAYAEGVLDIASARSEIKQMDREAITFLSDLDEKFLGCVLNNVELENVNM